MRANNLVIDSVIDNGLSIFTPVNTLSCEQVNVNNCL